MLEGELLSILSGFLKDQYQIQPKHPANRMVYISVWIYVRIKDFMLSLLELFIPMRDHRCPESQFTNRTGYSRDPNLPQAKKHTSWCQNHSIQYNFKRTNSLCDSSYCLHFGFNLKETHKHVSKNFTPMLKEIKQGVCSPRHQLLQWVPSDGRHETCWSGTCLYFGTR